MASASLRETLKASEKILSKHINTSNMYTKINKQTKIKITQKRNLYTHAAATTTTQAGNACTHRHQHGKMTDNTSNSSSSNAMRTTRELGQRASLAVRSLGTSTSVTNTPSTDAGAKKDIQIDINQKAMYLKKGEQLMAQSLRTSDSLGDASHTAMWKAKVREHTGRRKPWVLTRARTMLSDIDFACRSHLECIDAEKS